MESPITKRAKLYLDNMNLFKALKPKTPSVNLGSIMNKDNQSVL